MNILKNVLITGGSGLIGTHLINSLDVAEFNVFTMGRTPGRFNRPVTHLEVDLSKEWDAGKLPGEVDYIIHLAQSENFRLFPERASEVFFVNTVSTLKLADYARTAGVKNFIYASSAGIYGNSDSGFSEEQEIVYKNDLGFYLASKHCSEVILDNYSSYMKVAVLRLFFVYGKGQKPDMLIPRLLGFVRNGTPITLQGEHGIKINPTYVGDAVDAIKASLLLESSQKINVAGPDILSLREIGNLIGKAVDRTAVFDIQDSEAKNLIGDISKMSRLLTRPKTPFLEGLRSLIEERGD